MMDSLLPSEIARLVLGYLQEQKCEGAVKIFLESSPLLQECHLVAQRGGKYSTKVGGLSLVDILEKYCTVNTMVQEKLSRVTDSETLRHCNDLLDQLRYLLEGSSTRGHRFVVNISVPSQSSPSGPFGSPIVSGSNRKRHHSSSERGKRISKSLNSMMDKNAQNVVTQSCDTVEATPLESLPGHQPSLKQNDFERQTNTNDKYISKIESIMPAPKINQFDVPSSSTTNIQQVQPDPVSPNKMNVHSNYKSQSTETFSMIEPAPLMQSPNKCTAGTNTDGLMNYCTAEVQTGPSDVMESESDINDEPIENLSILTKKLLQRKELHERIAENINKAIMPVETSHREVNMCENQNEANLSLLNDFDTTIKSIVQATETDPVFEDFLKEIFKVGETDTSPDEDSDGRNHQVLNDGINFHNNNLMETDNNYEIMEPMKLIEETTGSEIPLKHRLRSSSKSQNSNFDEEDKDTNSILENQNAEAIMNIVNVINSKRNLLSNCEESNKEIVPIEPLPENPIVYEPPQEIIAETEIKKSEDKNKTLKPTAKKTKRVRLPKPPVSPKPLPPEPEVVPTLILCSESDVESLMQPKEVRGYIPIAPKRSQAPTPVTTISAPKIFLRTVNVPRHLVNPATIELSRPVIGTKPQILQMLPQQEVVSSDKAVSEGGGLLVSTAMNDPIVVPIVVTDEMQHVNDVGSTTAAIPVGHIPLSTESITLYSGGSESSAIKVSPISSMPIISLDDSSISLTAGSGLSPFFKDHVIGGDSVEVESSQKIEENEINKIEEQVPTNKLEQAEIVANTIMPMEVEDDCPEPVVLQVESEEDDLSVNALLKDMPEKKKEIVKSINNSATEIIVKRTPKTLLRSRAKNNRLSLSTPRRRNSHVRALDFNTPVKNGTAKKVPQSCTRSKSVCRAGLFKSPPFTGAIPNVNINLLPDTQPIVKRIKTVSPVKSLIYPEVPIATRSPAPKLQGNWAKFTGIGMILGDSSTSESSPDKTPHQEVVTVRIPSPIPEAPEESMEEVQEKKSELVSVLKVEKPIIEKKSWDSDLRKIVGTQVAENTKPKTRTRKASVRKKTSSAKTNECNTSGEIEVKDKTKDRKKVRDVKKSESDDKNSKTDNNSMKKVNDEINTTIEVGTDTAHETEITPPNVLLVSKKSYLEASCASKSNVENDKNVKNSNVPKNSPLNIMTARLPDMLDLETPRKTEVTFYVPPTPRLLVTPGDGLKTNRSKADLKIKDCVDTPDFPMTPCIVVTPRIVEEDNDKKPSPYYEPEEDPPEKFKEIVTEKVVVSQVQETATLTIQKTVVELQENKSIEITDYGVIEEKIHSKEQEEQEQQEQEQIVPEDISKEIVKEPSVEKANISLNSSTNSYSDSDDDSSDSDSSTSSSSSDSSSSSSSSDSSATSTPMKSIIQKSSDVASDISLELSPMNSVVQESTLVTLNNKESDTKSVTNNSLNESDQCNSELSLTKSDIQEISNADSLSFQKDISATESTTDDSQCQMQSPSKVAQDEEDELKANSQENSPAKVFSVMQEPADDIVKETPAKNENMIEAMISETPSVTDAERALRRDSLTNLTSKISAFITTSKSNRSITAAEESCVSTTEKSGLKIKSVEIIKSSDKTKEVSEMLQLGIQKNKNSMVNQKHAVLNNTVIDAKLSQQLEEKRLRTLAKLNGAKSPRGAGKGKKSMATKKSTETEKIVSSTSDNQKNKTKQQLENNKLDSNGLQKVENNKSDNVKSANKNEETTELKKGKGKASPRKKSAQIDHQSKIESVSNEVDLKKPETVTIQNIVKEPSASGCVNSMTAENIKGLLKSKVDLVKRDLFSDDEMNDQRTTRSQSARRTIGQKINNVDDSQDTSTSLNSSKEKLPGVLECLQLIPANKSDQELHDLSFSSDDNYGYSNSNSHVLDVSYVYDESVPIKKRKRKYSTSELQSHYTFSFDGEEEVHILTLTDGIELYKMPPKSTKIKASSSPKKSPLKMKKSNNKILENLSLPCLSPILAPNAKGSKLDDKKKKSCKRKATPQKEEQTVDKKMKVDPQALFNKIKVDEFLKLVHE